MDNKIDWSLAPEGATHKDASHQNGFWYKFDFDKNQACYWVGKGWTNPISCDSYNDGSMDVMDSRPAKQWSGPKDGLPPVSSVVMARRSDNNQWIKCEVLKHGTPGQASQVCAFMEIKTNRMFWSNDYEAVKTEEQIACDLRESKIVEFMNTVGIDCRVTATKAVDAGYTLGEKK